MSWGEDRRRKRERKKRQRARNGGGFKPISLVLVAAVVAAGVAVYFALQAAQPADLTAEELRSSPAPEGRPELETTRVAWIGDSYTAGAGAGTEPNYVDLVSTDLGWTSTNLGVGGVGYLPGAITDPDAAQVACGADTCPAYPALIADAVEAEPEVVVVSGGRNNVGTDPAALETAVSDFYADLRAELPDAQIVAVSPLWDSDEPPADLAELAGYVQAAVEDVGGEYVDIGQPLVGQPLLIDGDGIHPNPEGYEVLAKALERRLSPVV